MEDKVELMQALTIQYGVKVLMALVIFIIGKWVVKRLSVVLEKLMEKNAVDPAIRHFAGSLVYYALLIFVCIAALGQLGIQTASFVAIVGAAGLAVGLALQGSLSNFAAGVLLLIFRPFKVGDFVEDRRHLRRDSKHPNLHHRPVHPRQQKSHSPQRSNYWRQHRQLLRQRHPSCGSGIWYWLSG